MIGTVTIDGKTLIKPQESENQLKVIKDKYLRDAPSIAHWLWGIAYNIALAEIINHPKANEWGIFDNVLYREIPHEDCASLLLFHDGIHDAAERYKNFFTFMGNLNRVVKLQPEASAIVEEQAEKFYEMLARWDFLPNSPTLMNAGRELQQLSACYVLPVPDSMEGILNTLKNTGLIHKSGGGTGFSFGRLRPSGDRVKSTSGVASGALSFMQIFDKMTDVVKQGGTRRGANMGILPYYHPEIREFITMKSKPGVMENFNVSVTIDKKFMDAVSDNSEIDLINPKTGKVVGKENAKDLFDLIIEYAYKTGDPGLIIIDAINDSRSNPTPAIGQIESTNPCGEQPLLPNEPCNLGSINLSNFVTNGTSEPDFDYERLGKIVTLATRFLDNVIDVNNYPIPEIEKMAKGNRRIGLGIMGWAESLVKLRIPYDSDEAIEKTREVMKFINEKSLEASCELAIDRGAFPFFKDSIYDKDGKYFNDLDVKPRNCARTTIAPTGTIAITAGLQGGGIEPFFGITYTRYNAKALDAIKKGEKPNDGDVFYEVNPFFEEVAQKNNYFGLSKKELLKKIDENHKSVRGISEIPERFQALFASAHDISFDFHVRIQAAFQEFTDNAVSKTINLPHDATVDDVRAAYLLAYQLGCKGITIYRDGSKIHQVLNLSDKKKEVKTRDLSEGGSAEYFEIQTGYGPLHIHIDYNEHGPYRIFTNIPPVGTEISGLASVIGILLSKYLESGGDIQRIIKHLNSVKGDRPHGFGEKRVNSIPHAIAKALRKHLERQGKIVPKEINNFANTTESEVTVTGVDQYHKLTAMCSNCYSTNVSFQSGCTGPTCHDCGYSECS